MNVQKGGNPSQVNRAAGHIVFVEGGSRDAFDPTVIRELLRVNKIPMGVSEIGTCDNVVEAAKAMVWDHPTYYFLADRDGRDAAFVEHSWANFPKIDTYNLLFWRQRELENYFIEPEYFRRSEWFAKTEDEARALVLAQASRRLFIEAANLVLLKIRGAIVSPPMVWFREVEKFATRIDALTALQTAPELDQRGFETAALLDKGERERMLDETLSQLTGGTASLEYGKGDWLAMLSGKELFRTVAGQLFQVKDAGGKILQGREQNNEVAKGLLRGPLETQPQDFQQLVSLLQAKVAVP